MLRTHLVSVITLLSASALGIAGDDFAGKWVNTEKDTGGLTRLEITKSEKGWTVHSWGTAGQGLENDLGEVALHLLVESSRGKEWKHGIATSDAKFKDSYLMLRFEKGELIAEDFNVFKDNSGRPNYRAVYKFKKVNDNLNPR